MFRQAYTAQALNARLGLPYYWTRRDQLAPSFGVTRYFDFQGVTPIGPQPVPLTTTCLEPCQTTAFAVTVSLDHRDEPLTARDGWQLLADVIYNPPVLGSDFHFVRVEPELRGYVPLGRRFTFAARARVGALFPLGGTESPIVARFFGGGEGGHRGFGAEQLSPLIEDAPDRFIPIGGDGLWLTTAELRTRWPNDFGAVAFVDWGSVTVEPLSFALSESFVAVGVGARYYTPAGPVRVDVAFRPGRRSLEALDTGRPADTRTGDFLALFLSLGEAF